MQILLSLLMTGPLMMIMGVVLGVHMHLPAGAAVPMALVSWYLFAAALKYKLRNRW